MPTPSYAWIKDDQGKEIHGSVEISGREGSIEVMEFHHDLRIPTDPHTGRLTGVRMHSPVRVIKAFDASSPSLYRACCEGQTFKEVRIDWYEIDDAGKEIVYFYHLLENVKVAAVRAYMPNTKEPDKERYTHLEEVSFVYGKITWHHTEGSLEHTDAWISER